MSDYRGWVCVGVVDNKLTGILKSIANNEQRQLALVFVNKFTLEKMVISKTIGEWRTAGVFADYNDGGIEGLWSLLSSNKYGVVDSNLNIKKECYTIIAIQKNFVDNSSKDFCPTCIVADPTGYTFEVNVHSEYFGYGRFNTEFCKKIINLSTKSNNNVGIKVTPYIKPYDYTQKRTITLTGLIEMGLAKIEPYYGKINADDWFADYDDVYKAEFEKLPTQRIVLAKSIKVARPEYTDIVIDPIAPSLIEGGLEIKCNVLRICGNVLGIGRSSIMYVRCNQLILEEGLKYIGPKAFRMLQAKYVEIPVSLEYIWYDNFDYINQPTSRLDRKIVAENEKEFVFNCKHPLIADRGYKYHKNSIRKLCELSQKYRRKS